MKFGKRLQIQIEETLPEWRDKFLCYKHLKKRLKHIAAPECFTEAAFDAPSPTCGSTDENCVSFVDAAVKELKRESRSTSPSRVSLQLNGLHSEDVSGLKIGRLLEKDSRSPSEKSRLDLAHGKQTDNDLEPGSYGGKRENSTPDEHDSLSRAATQASETDQLTKEEAEFVYLLNVELDKFNTFFIEKEEEYVIRLQELKERIEKLQERSGPTGSYPYAPDFNKDLIQIRKDIVTFHGEMVLLENYSSLNYTGLVKILKKHDKRTGALLRLPFIQSVLHQPFFTTELLSKLVLECEINLHSIFPDFPNCEVTVNHLNQECETRAVTQARDVSVLRGEDVDSIYRSTIAALRTIRDLRKGSSTHSSLSISPLSRSDKDESHIVVNDNVSMPFEETPTNSIQGAQHN